MHQAIINRTASSPISSPVVTKDIRQETETSPNPYIKEAQSESFDPVNRIRDLLPMPTWR
ncbi:MAG: hypothetical protein MK006_14340 [Pirellulales bacterium]|nr:hypothetical protein [Pirellulales bacterium]